MAKRPRLSWP